MISSRKRNLEETKPEEQKKLRQDTDAGELKSFTVHLLDRIQYDMQ